MLDRHKLELTLLEIARQNDEGVDSNTLYTIRNGVAQVLQAKERHRRADKTESWL
ncbi:MULTISPECIES: hypothetical protein [Klebsiella]|mgnify:CR=1 FL=1|uniref:hypothetical protein n=1 Tax=Klebsiella TaxID=570 RepID=UPI000E2AE58D|nr:MULTISPECIES: hypothetical protein [Klebsiella]EKP1130935.1 hypothetical protein [Klebsiella michiganensis]MBN4044791.1 hypothetical protein [Klebsiella michiganensis]MDH0489377.1 hypothetical protein [Klebsiella michiganensis]MDM6773316.1 hypothetical protein [Klebsiella michiganensis]MDQ2562161.1 hypothetical protein [Klebsiella michiganensis]